MNINSVEWDRICSIARVLRNVDFPENGTGCWVYKGKSKVLRYKGRREYVYRIVVMALYDISLTSSDFVCHQCDNSWCVNPGHLEVGDAARNANDRTILKIPQMIRLLQEAGYVVSKPA